MAINITTEQNFAEFLKSEVERLRKNPPTKEEAIQNLIKIGVLEADGKTLSEHHRIEG